MNKSLHLVHHAVCFLSMHLIIELAGSRAAPSLFPWEQATEAWRDPKSFAVSDI